ncbi:hypothetical protein PF002_g1125 [Phytophthora fragariae]|uniref:Uncharacterized protein n=1 Tax=Phytophthora fragariae TaxID=53985 RepID=A0A6A3FUX3_9STRA|nr:hypothetical protein PF009_g1133 [Phytophthora fragariae]KAE9028610.1 hypothetical protein PF011_g1482 [Phytophthora fragariae]KAE9139561.1 hypothetical protein PF007_g982 [Phytophthora fragariae]KAE9155090.1 hypothetical protein PF006_g918 [Phytophthora fragariae]KAE9252573.1 hypothetical protein PF004_g1920 [Phytophthora fragariae]
MFVAISVFLVVLLLLGFSLLEFSFLEISVFTSGVIPTGVLPMEFSVLLVALVAFSLDLLRMGTLEAATKRRLNPVFTAWMDITPLTILAYVYYKSEKTIRNWVRFFEASGTYERATIASGYGFTADQ